MKHASSSHEQRCDLTPNGMREKYEILLVDDDRTLSPLVKDYLETKEFDCVLFHTATDALAYLEKHSVDVCILDIRMPEKDGYTLATEIRLLNPETPFLFLTAESNKEDRIKGLEAGAEDYITKPFSMKELELRLKIILRRFTPEDMIKSSSSFYQIGLYRFDPGSRELQFENHTQKLSAIESKLLQLFCVSPEWVIERDYALKKIWSDENNFRERSMNVYISKLRQYLKLDPAIEIQNIHGAGYKLYIR